MTEQLDPKLVQRIQKLHAMAESAREVGSLAEADSFMAAVSKTLNKHNLDMSVLSIDLRDSADPMGSTAEWGAMKRHRNRPVAWAQNLAVHVARAHNCAILVSPTTSIVIFYGRASNRGVAQRMFRYLRDMGERLNWQEYAVEVRRRRKEHGSERGGGEWRLNWLEGYVAEVGRRYAVLQQQVEADKGMAMVLVSVRKEAEAAADQKAVPFEKLKRTRSAVMAESWHEEARNRGTAAAKTVNLRPETLDTTDTKAAKALRGT